jgi:hypothetical protein
MSAGRRVNTKSKSWGTPSKYIDVIKLFFEGTIDLDPCSNEYSIVNADINYMMPQNNGLIDSWNYKRIFVNPPYGRDKDSSTSIKDWLRRCLFAHRDHNSEVIALIPVATNSSHWKEFIFPKANSICFLYDTRLKFLENGQNGGKGAPMACCLVYWGNDYNKFYNSFIDYGAVLPLKTLKDKKIGKY